MSMLKNFLPLSREVRTHWIYKDPDYFIVWCEMLFAARFFKEPKTDIYQNTIYTIQYGEFIFGRTGWGERLHVGEQKLRTLVKRLILENMIQLVEQKGRRFTIYKIVNYEKYNHPDNQPETYTESDFEGDTNQPTNRTPTISQPSANHQLTTNKTIKKDKKVNKDIHCTEIIEYLNTKASTQYRDTSQKTQDLIKARVNEGCTLDDFKKVIDIKTDEWLNTDMSKFLRPETLFSNKFEGYLNQKGSTKERQPDYFKRLTEYKYD